MLMGHFYMSLFKCSVLVFADEGNETQPSKGTGMAQLVELLT